MTQQSTHPKTAPRRDVIKDLPQQVRAAAAWVAAQAEHIHIHTERIDAYTDSLLSRYPVVTKLDSHTHFISEAAPATTACFVLALDSVNFGSGYFALAKAAGLNLEYETVAHALKNAFMADRMNTPEKWREATAQDCHDIFVIPKGCVFDLDQLMALFAQHLQNSGRMVMQHDAGDVLSLLKAANQSAAQLAGIVAAWQGFQDKTRYKGRDIPFYKRAQIVAADMYLAFQSKAPADFQDMDSLTSFPDNMVPHVLRHDGIFEYSPALVEKIDNGVLIGAGSAEETELRALGIHAVELIKKAAARQGHHVSSMNIDHILWNRGYEPDIYAKPSHRTMTVWY